MKYKNYLAIGFMAVILLPFSGINAEANTTTSDALSDQNADNLELGFNTEGYLPEDFDPYAIGDVLSSINYMEEEDDLELGFDATPYLPENFNPYRR